MIISADLQWKWVDLDGRRWRPLSAIKSVARHGFTAREHRSCRRTIDTLVDRLHSIWWVQWTHQSYIDLLPVYWLVCECVCDRSCRQRLWTNYCAPDDSCHKSPSIVQLVIDPSVNWSRRCYIVSIRRDRSALLDRGSISCPSATDRSYSPMFYAVLGIMRRLCSARPVK